MVYFHEIIGPILAMIAVMMTILLFKKTIDSRLIVNWIQRSTNAVRFVFSVFNAVSIVEYIACTKRITDAFES